MNEHNEAEAPAPTGTPAGVSRRGLLAAGTVLGAGAALGSPTAAVPANTTVTYPPDNNPDLQNPERGLYRQPGDSADMYGNHSLVEEWLWLQPVCHEKLTWYGRNDPRNHWILAEYAKKLHGWREKGMKVIFRPRYDVKGTGSTQGCVLDSGITVFHAATKELQLNHIDAVAKMLRDNRDAIGAVQAGYFGRWGEWHAAGQADPNNPNTKFGPKNAPLLYNEQTRSEILDRILIAYGSGNNKLLQPVELRMPVFAKEALNRNRYANVGLHNDCFMSTLVQEVPDDYGTYLNFPGSSANKPKKSNEGDFEFQKRVRQEWVVEAQRITANKSFGGETCPSDGVNERWRKRSAMLSEPGALHMNYLNRDYAEGALKAWVDGGFYNDVRRRLGYRFEVAKAEYTPTVSTGQRFTVTLDIKNTGWARLHKPRNAKLIFRQGSTPLPAPYVANSGGATVNWAPGVTTRVKYDHVAPPAGTYSLHLAIFDPDSPVDHGKPPARNPKWAYDYAVKLASLRNGKNIFNAGTGENDLGITITVK